MKKLLSTLFFIVLLVVATIFIGKSILAYVDEQNNKTEAAMHAVKCRAYRLMLMAETEKNVRKLGYYRWQYENPEKVVADYGVEYILAKEKNR